MFFMTHAYVCRAFNQDRATKQNITVGVSFGATRELAFIHATQQKDGSKLRVYFPQTNNGVFTFGRDVNILWKVLILHFSLCIGHLLSIYKFVSFGLR